ncbi:unnamed protein product [Cuscuta epithymum]|uniref:Zinc knuckle CX2CX4HX4C domain-containing protein n=1 Tax=Cuscuta epithymum TaxID=186058 RepID=A0AAV0FKE9_9ASTE|nr:unnamed protein product [Cuscuta epithymum]
MRIRVRMDVRRPLKKCTTLKKVWISQWVDFKYEKLPNFYFVCGIIGHSDKFCPIVYEGENITFNKIYGLNLRPGGGVKTSPTGGNKWLIEGSSNTCMRLPQRSDSQDTDKQGWKETTTGTGIGSIKEGNSVSPEEGSGEQKRRRNWEEKEQEDPAGEDMALDRQKGSVGGLVVVHLKFESFSYFFCCCFS